MRFSRLLAGKPNIFMPIVLKDLKSLPATVKYIIWEGNSMVKNPQHEICNLVDKDSPT